MGADWYDSRGAKVGRDYVEKVMKQAMKEKTIAGLAGTTAYYEKEVYKK